MRPISAHTTYQALGIRVISGIPYPALSVNEPHKYEYSETFIVLSALFSNSLADGL